jgi:BolA protein
MNSARHQKIENLLVAFFQPKSMILTDESHLHKGHEGAKSGLSHYHLTIQSDRLDGLSLIAQHRLIYQVLGDLMKTDIHALRIHSVK